MKAWKTNGRGVASRRFAGVVVVLLVLTGVTANAGDSPLEGEEIASHVRRFRSRDAFAVVQAVQGAHRRLADSRCQAIFSDFAKPSGQGLQEVLDEQGQTGQSHLLRLLFTTAPRPRAAVSPESSR